MAKESNQRPLKWGVSSAKIEVDLQGTPDVTVEVVLIHGVGNDDSKLTVIDDAIRALLPQVLAFTPFLTKFTALAVSCPEGTLIPQSNLRSLVEQVSVKPDTMSVTVDEQGESGIWMRRKTRSETSPTVDIECDYYGHVYVRAFAEARTVRQAYLKLLPFISTLEKGGLTHLSKLRKALAK